MKTIKFKGLRLDGKGWLYGDFINSLEYGAMIMLTAHCGGNSFDEAPSDYQDSVQVKPETLGQFTGLQDKNELDIYEGDIVEHNKIMYNNSIRKSDVIVFEEGCFRLKKSTSLYIICGNDFKVEVIGNIHEK